MSQDDNSHRLDLGTVIAAIHDSEINGEISWFFDGTWRVQLGDEMNGFDAEGIVASPQEAAEWLRANAVRHRKRVREVVCVPGIVEDPEVRWERRDHED